MGVELFYPTLYHDGPLLATEAKVFETGSQLDGLFRLREDGLDSGAIMQTSDELEGYKRGLKFLQSMYVVLWPAIQPITDEPEVTEGSPENA